MGALDFLCRGGDRLFVRDINPHELHGAGQIAGLEAFHRSLSFFAGPRSENDKVGSISQQLGCYFEPDAAVGFRPMKLVARDMI